MQDGIIAYPGIPLTMQKITPGDTITTVAAGLYKYTEYEIGYDAGHAAALIVEGNIITGATSGAMGVVRSVTVATGAIGDSDAAGMIRFHSWNGTNFTDNEKIKIAADADVGDINGSVPTECTDGYAYAGWIAKAVMIRAITKTQLIGVSARKMKADQTTLIGFALAATASPLWIYDASAIANITTVDEVSGQAGSTILLAYF
jgi:hypothetical protein